MAQQILVSTAFNSLEETRKEASVCIHCNLHQTRTHVVFGSGNPQAKIMFIGEGPGQTEDETGLPFVGRAGQLLSKIIESVGFSREQDTYIANVVKCRPPGNRVPTEQEMATCFPYLQAQIHFIKPKIVVLVGATALKGVLGIQSPISKIRGRWLETPFENAKGMAIFHPSYLLRNASNAEGTPKWLTWQDIQEIRRVYNTLLDSSKAYWPCGEA
jgi:uracil-DNA glycosylase